MYFLATKSQRHKVTPRLNHLNKYFCYPWRLGVFVAFHFSLLFGVCSINILNDESRGIEKELLCFINIKKYYPYKEVLGTGRKF
jgi:hypothetical protein